MTFRRVCAASLIVVLSAIGALAFASPPDPAWIGGFYDDDDFDVSVSLITESLPAVAPSAVCDAAPSSIVVVSLRAVEARLTPAPPPGSDASRAPPAA